MASFIHSILGFGFPLLATPLLSVFVTVKEAILLTLFPNLVVNSNIISRTSSFGSLWNEYKLLVLSLVFGSFLGTNLLILYYSEYYKILLALITLLYLNKEYINFSLEESINNNPKKMMLFFGFISGVVSGLINVMFPILVIYILESNVEKEKSYAIMNLCFFSSKLMQVVVFGFYGNFTLNFAFIAVPIVIISIVGIYLGDKVRHKLNDKIYRQILLFTLWVLSFYLIFDFFI